MRGFKQFLICGVTMAFVAGQFWCVLNDGVTSMVSQAQVENALALQGHDPSVPERANDGLVAEAEGAPMLGGIPVAFGENAPGKLPARLGMPQGGAQNGHPEKVGGVPGAMPGIPGKDGKRGIPGKMAGKPGAMSGVPGKVEAEPGKTIITPGAVSGVPGEALGVPGKAVGVAGKVAGTPGKVAGVAGKVAGMPGKVAGVAGKVAGTPGKVAGTPGKVAGTPGKVAGTPGKIAGAPGRSGNGSGGGKPGEDPYRVGLQIIYYLEEKGGEYALTPMQAKHALRLIRANESNRESVPNATRVIQEVLTPEQMSFVRARLSVEAAKGKRTSPDLLDAYASETLRKMK